MNTPVWFYERESDLCCPAPKSLPDLVVPLLGRLPMGIATVAEQNIR